MKKRNQHGFTLMELMVVIVIVAILAAVAVPLYINYVNDARRTEAKGAIAALISGAQVFYQKQPTPTYAGLNTNPDSVKVASITAESAARWTYQFSNLTTTGFTITATGIGTANGLGVTCVYTRTPAAGAEPATWTEQ